MTDSFLDTPRYKPVGVDYEEGRIIFHLLRIDGKVVSFIYDTTTHNWASVDEDINAALPMLIELQRATEEVLAKTKKKVSGED